MKIARPSPRFPLRNPIPDEGPLPILRPRLRRSSPERPTPDAGPVPRPGLRASAPQSFPETPTLIDHLIDVFLRIVRFAWRLPRLLFRIGQHRLRRASRRPSLAMV